MRNDRFVQHLWIPDDFERDRGYGGGGGGGGGRNSGEHLQRRMLKLIKVRVRRTTPPAIAQRVRFPIGIFFARNRGTGHASDIREEMVSSFEYWSKDSGEYFDMFFPGWYFQKELLRFNSRRFIEYREEIERKSKWRYSGETDLLILNCDFDLQTREASLGFDQVIILQVEAMIRDKKIGSLPALLSVIHNAAKASGERGENSVVWEMSDGIGFLRGRQSLWEALKKSILRDFSQVYDNVRPFGVFDLRVRA